MKFFAILLSLLSFSFSFSVTANDYFKALELFNQRKIEQSLIFLKKLPAMKKMRKEVMQCLILQ